jgi:ankyrin repeat protein
MKILGLLSSSVLVLFIMAGPALAQMPPDTQFLEDIRDKKYGDTMAYLVNGGSPDVRDYRDIPAIVAAAKIGDAGMVKELLKYGANPNLAVKKTHVTALMQGAARGYIPVVAVLVTNNASIDKQDNLGETALIKAVKEGHREMARHLLDIGADPELTDYSGHSAYDHAQRSRDRSMRSLLEKAVSGG